jgi:uncharacterized protein YecE (DUF72 family)
MSAEIRLGTSAFTAAGWEGTFYPAGMQARDFLTYYATKFDTVEIDSTYYRTPAVTTVQGWYSKTPKDFVFAAKIPNIITHEKMLTDVDEDFKYFLTTMGNLKDKLGPLLFQFPYFNRKAFPGVNDFLARLSPVLKTLPRDHKFAVEIRNKNWLVPQFFETLREHNVAFVLIDQSWMPRPWELFENFDPITADFTYIRWLGDRKGIEKQTKVWNKVIVDRHRDLAGWVEIVKKIHERRIQVYAYANNHYAGYAPKTVEMFQSLLKIYGISENRSPQGAPTDTLFDL